MKAIVFITSIYFFNIGFAQTIFWHESFGSGCNQGSYALGAMLTVTNGIWNVEPSGQNGTQANDWFISSTTSGTTIGNCMDGCLNDPGSTNKTLHIGKNLAQPNKDVGAFYIRNATSPTNKRVESPGINCSNQASISISFNYLVKGLYPDDYCEVLWFNGTLWSSLGVLSPAVSGCTATATWTNITYQLPQFAEGNPGIKIGFRWENTASVGSDNISVAIDDIRLFGTPITNIKNHQFENLEIEIFPNPFTQNLVLKNGKKTLNLDKLVITNNIGQVIYSEEKISFENKKQIDVSQLPKGIYFLTLSTQNSQKTFKILKE